MKTGHARSALAVFAGAVPSTRVCTERLTNALACCDTANHKVRLMDYITINHPLVGIDGPAPGYTRPTRTTAVDIGFAAVLLSIAAGTVLHAG